jgi:hypothetical protein
MLIQQIETWRTIVLNHLPSAIQKQTFLNHYILNNISTRPDPDIAMEEKSAY